MPDANQWLAIEGNDPDALILGDVPLAEFTAALTLGNGWNHPKIRNGKPCNYFWKEVLPAGREFFDSKGSQWRFDPPDIDGAIETLKLARTKGFEPCCPAAHTDLKGRNYGFIVDARKNAKGNLELLHQFIGKDETDEAMNKKTSICIIPHVKFSDGTNYVNLIHHNAILPHPQITDLDDFQPALAASGQAAIRAVVLSMAAPTPKEVQMDLSTLRAKLGAATDVTDEKLIELATQRIGEADALKADKLALSNDLAAARKAPAAKPATLPSAEQLHYLGKTLQLSQDEAAKAAGGDVVKRAAKRYLGSETFDTGTLTLSHEPEDADVALADGMRRMIDFCELVKHAKTDIKPGEKTGGQRVLALGNIPTDDPKEGELSPEEDKALRESVRKHMSSVKKAS